MIEINEKYTFLDLDAIYKKLSPHNGNFKIVENTDSGEGGYRLTNTLDSGKILREHVPESRWGLNFYDYRASVIFIFNLHYKYHAIEKVFSDISKIISKLRSISGGDIKIDNLNKNLGTGSHYYIIFEKPISTPNDLNLLIAVSKQLVKYIEGLARKGKRGKKL